MNNALGVAWRQLSHQKMKLVAAGAGVVVAVMLMLVQLGIRQGAIDNSVSFVKLINSELVVTSPRTKTIFSSAQFPRRLLYRLPADPEVEAVDEVYMSLAQWKNSWEKFEHPINVFGLNPARAMIDLPGLKEREELFLQSDTAIFDRRSRSSYGPVAATIDATGSLDAEVNLRRLHVFDTISVGISITTDGNLYCSQANFLRLFPNRQVGAIDLGMVRLKPSCNAEEVASRLQLLLGKEARVMTSQQLIDEEIRYLRSSRPLDFIFGMGAAVGFFIGFVVVYQILYTEVTNHLPQLATMKAMGFTDRYLLRLVVWQAVILSTIGYIPGFLMALGLYRVAGRQIQMPFTMTWERASGVWLATLVMCSISAMIAVRKAWSADPAEVF